MQPARAEVVCQRTFPSSAATTGVRRGAIVSMPAWLPFTARIAVVVVDVDVADHREDDRRHLLRRRARGTRSARRGAEAAEDEEEGLPGLSSGG